MSNQSYYTCPTIAAATAGGRGGRLKLALAAVLAAAAAITTGLTIAPAASADGTTTLTGPVTGTIPAIDGLVNGTVGIQKLVLQNGKVFADGALTGTLADSAGGAIQTVSAAPVSLPLDASTSCQILDLSLGALDINLLGLLVHLDPINLDITAQTGDGALLGNLLCMVSNLLNGSSSLLLPSLVNELNLILFGLT